MKKLLLGLAMLLCSSGALADHLYIHDGDDYGRVEVNTKLVCADPKVRTNIKDALGENPDEYRVASVTFEGVTYSACGSIRPEGFMCIMLDNPGAGHADIDMAAFKNTDVSL